MRRSRSERRWMAYHGTVAVAVVVALGFAASFLTDGVSLEGPFGALETHRVTVPGTIGTCTPVYGRSRQGVAYAMTTACQVSYSYGGHQFETVLIKPDPAIYLVDPKDPTITMSQATYRHAPTEIDGDLVVAGTLATAAAGLTVHHVLWWRRRRKRRRLEVHHEHNHAHRPGAGPLSADRG